MKLTSIYLSQVASNKIFDYLIDIVNLLSAAVGIIVVISIIVGGIQYITSDGNPQNVAAAKERIRNSILAFVIYIFGFAVLQYLIPGGLM